MRRLRRPPGRRHTFRHEPQLAQKHRARVAVTRRLLHAEICHVGRPQQHGASVAQRTLHRLQPGGVVQQAAEDVRQRVHGLRLKEGRTLACKNKDRYQSQPRRALRFSENWL